MSEWINMRNMNKNSKIINLAILLPLVLIVACTVPNYTKGYSDIRWQSVNGKIASGKILLDGVFCTAKGLQGNNWWWKFYEDGSCIAFYVDKAIYENMKIDFAKTYIAGEDITWDSLYNNPGVYRITGDTIHVNLYKRIDSAYGSISYLCLNNWYLSRIKMRVKDKGHLVLMNDDEGHSTLDYSFVPCCNIVYPKRLMELKDTKMMWSDRKEWKKWKKMKAN